MRPLAWLTMLSLLALTFGAAPQRAVAQEQRARSVAILDFANDGGDAILGRAASAALHLKMTERQYNVRARSEVREAFVRLGLREPLEPDEVRRLFQDLDTELVVGGRVLKVEQGDSPRPWARVLLRVEVYDGASGDLTNGAIAEGYETGTGTSQTDREATLNDAVERAATKALETIEANTLIEGKVMLYSPVDDPPKVVLNRGMKYGVQDGMLFDIFRVDLDPSDASRTRQFKVGRIKVTSVSSDEAEGVVLETNGGIRTNDILRQVFAFPAVDEVVPVRDTRGNVVQGPKQPKRGGGAGLLGPLLGVVGGLAGLALLLTMNNNQNTSAPRVNPNTGAYLQQA
ncbi:MAG: hypothetical protein HYU66_16590, partial [Armatimonadetes bacterium]|nr:hypothetical protein [Armatimonadota bacterium]